jgi:hypothetical protein
MANQKSGDGSLPRPSFATQSDGVAHRLSPKIGATFSYPENASALPLADGIKITIPKRLTQDVAKLITKSGDSQYLYFSW